MCASHGSVLEKGAVSCSSRYFFNPGRADVDARASFSRAVGRAGEKVPRDPCWEGLNNIVGNLYKYRLVIREPRRRVDALSGGVVQVEASAINLMHSDTRSIRHRL